MLPPNGDMHPCTVDLHETLRNYCCSGSVQKIDYSCTLIRSTVQKPTAAEPLSGARNPRNLSRNHSVFQVASPHFQWLRVKCDQRKPKLCRFLDFLCGAEQPPQVSFCNNRCRFQLYVWSHATHTIFKIGRMLPKLF